MPLILELVDGGIIHQHALPVDVHRPWQLKDSLIAAASEHDEVNIYAGDEIVGRCIDGVTPQVKQNGKWVWE